MFSFVEGIVSRCWVGRFVYRRLMDMGLDGSRVLVTGGAGGIGAAICRAFAAEGAVVAVHYHQSGEAAQALATELGGIAVKADLTVPAEVDGMFSFVIDELGGLDVCIANAGKYPGFDQPIWEISPTRWRETIDANLTTVFLTARGFLNHALTTGKGSLVMTGSTAGSFGEAGSSDYAAAKGAINYGLLLSLKNEAARIGDGVRVNAVAPGWTITPKREQAGVDSSLVAKATSTMARKTLATPHDVAAQVVVLASDFASAHITGQLVTVAGGMEGRLVP
jgi:3-oxoacyl-[acyl-carrier protein] reductase